MRRVNSRKARDKGQIGGLYTHFLNSIRDKPQKYVIVKREGKGEVFSRRNLYSHYLNSTAHRQVYVKSTSVRYRV